MVDSPDVPHSSHSHQQRHSYFSVAPASPQPILPQPPPLPSSGPIAGLRTGSSEHLSSVLSTSPVQQPTIIVAPPAPPPPQSAPIAVPVAAGPAPVRNRVLDFPAVRFLLRPDFFNLLHLNDEALAQYNGSPTLKSMVTRIRREGQQNPPLTGSFDRHQHNRYLVALINKFAETSRPLPHGMLLCEFFISF